MKFFYAQKPENLKSKKLSVNKEEQLKKLVQV